MPAGGFGGGRVWTVGARGSGFESVADGAGFATAAEGATEADDAGSIVALEAAGTAASGAAMRAGASRVAADGMTLPDGDAAMVVFELDADHHSTTVRRASAQTPTSATAGLRVLCAFPGADGSA